MRKGSFPDAVKTLIWERDGYACIMCGKSTTQIHHRRRRGSGGTSVAWVSEPPNGIVLCGSGVDGCHGWVESHPVEAVASGWVVPLNHRETASEIPVNYPMEGKSFFLTRSGEKSRFLDVSAL